MKMRGFILWLVVGLSIGQGTVAVAEEEPVGIVLAVQGTVTMQPATMTPPVPLRQFDEIGRLSILESQPGSRCKVLYADDSLLTLGDNSRLVVYGTVLRGRRRSARLRRPFGPRNGSRARRQAVRRRQLDV